MNDHWYLVDNNALAALGRQRRSSQFFSIHCRLPDEVLHEASGFPDIDDLQSLRYDTTAAVLRYLKTVMASVPNDDTKLVNLYANHGNADPIIIACALDARYREECTLLPAVWTIVSDDGAVREKARHFEIPILTGNEFKTLIDG